jgi:hypothetical protein
MLLLTVLILLALVSSTYAAAATVTPVDNSVFDRSACFRSSNIANVTLCAACTRAMVGPPCVCGDNDDTCANRCENAIAAFKDAVMRRTATECRVCDTLKANYAIPESVCAPFCALPECILPTVGHDVSDRAAACYAALRYFCPLMTP